MDETWVWRYHCKKKGIGPKIATIGGSKTNKGDRLIVIDAMTKDGPVSNFTEDGDEISTSHISWQYKADGDYHSAMNSDEFKNWVNQFILAFQAKYPGKKCTLVLDNAPYHMCGMFNPLASSVTIKELTDYLKRMKDEKIRVTRNGLLYEFDIENPGSSRKKADKPTKEELQAATMQAMKEKDDEFLYTWLELRFKELGWEVIFTPPYLPAFQPIELVWADCKNYIAKSYRTGRSFDMIKSDFIAKSQTVDGAKLVRHAEDRMNTWIEQDSVLSGSLENLIIPPEYKYLVDSCHAKFYSEAELDIMNQNIESTVTICINDVTV